jgi:hypothetical protein
VRNSADSPPASDPLAQYLDAVRRPLEFLAAASPATAARTQLPGHELAARGRALRGRLPEGPQREVLDALCSGLERLTTVSAAQRVTLAGECRRLLTQIGAPAPAGRRAGVRLPAQQRRSVRRAQPLALPVQFAKEVGPRRAALLRKFGIETVEDLLYHLPFRYEDRRRVREIGSVQPGEEASIVGELAQLAERTVGRGRRRILEGVLRDATGLLGLTWYHHTAYHRARYRVGQRLRVYGKVDRSPGGGKRIVHPEIDVATDEPGGAGILPVYEKPTTMTVGTIRKIVQQAVRDYAELIPGVLPETVTGPSRLLDPASALRAIHIPEAEADVERLNRFASAAQRALVFDELFFLQLGMGLRRRQTARESGLAMPRSGALTGQLAAILPFPLTAAQRRVLEQIYADMQRPHPMHRLLQGDVGSGKTIVALFAALVAIENGCQAAFMAPTELLAEQHFSTIAGSPRRSACASRCSPATRPGRAASGCTPSWRAARSGSPSAPTR